MTCIVALESGGKVYMGGDSASVGGYDIQTVANPKVFIKGDFIIGYTSSFRMGQLLQYDFVIPHNDRLDDLEYLVAKVIPAIRECFRAGGYTEVNNNRESSGTFLLGYRGKIYRVEGDFQVSRYTSGFDACGCGENFALGALTALDKSNPTEAVRRALLVAERHSAGVRAPFHILSL